MSIDQLCGFMVPFKTAWTCVAVDMMCLLCTAPQVNTTAEGLLLTALALIAQRGLTDTALDSSSQGRKGLLSAANKSSD